MAQASDPVAARMREDGRVSLPPVSPPSGAPELVGWTHAYAGKVRDLYLPAAPHPDGDVVLVVASDRISA